ncbi:hypothetical protein COCNU_07G008840 [Cocos nucifera]|uniref:V-type proton ATPase subunit a n=1 Tax=Cocos nucifera TaxID=13894 RepID=A0A8K0N4Z4_COCNU|nr:hypothetical protein COCNU_07G008840 [Cocos nucifera]
MDLMRSEPMQLVQIIIPIESAHLTVSYLGDLGLLQFKDLNADKSPFQRTYANQIKRCGEMARKLRFFREQMTKADISPSAMPITQTDIDLDDLEVKLGELEAELIEVNSNGEKLQRTFNELLEYKLVLQKKLGDIMEMTFGGRYVIMMMAIFSIYTGLIYNEFFSVPFELFGQSAYACRDPSCRGATTEGLIKVRPAYPFGVDPKWHGTRSELPFLNSLKMKMSILLGVAQMNLGIVLSYFNAKFFRNNLNIWYQFVPQLIFLNSLFGYLSLLIIVKWCTGSKADLYHVMIYMFLSPTDDLGENQLFPGQKTLQLVLLLLALISVPWMLFPKPILLKKQHQERHQGQSYTMLQSTEELLELDHGHSSHGHGNEEFEFSEVFVHQLIHTIEFVLGAVSNTASYLRLWALSLAHSELSSVFYEKVLLLAWGFNNIIILIIGFIVFVFATVGVLLVMETLSAFLHALRLHWVEFQNKFYEGDGYKFSPFSFALLAEDED